MDSKSSTITDWTDVKYERMFDLVKDEMKPSLRKFRLIPKQRRNAFLRGDNPL